MFVYRVLCLEGNGRLFKISTDILENTRFVTLALVNTYLQIPANGERLGFRLSFYLPKLNKEKYI